MNYRRQVIESGLRVGSRGSIQRSFTADDVETFGRITGDRNPYHFNPAFAADSRYGRPIVHGLLVAAMLTEIGGQWAWLATEMSFRFLAPVYVGDTVSLEIEVTALSEKNFASAEARWTNQEGKLVLQGSLGGYPPSPAQRKLLAETG